MAKVNVKVTSHKDKVLSELKKRKAAALEAIGTQGEGNTVLMVDIMDAVDTGNLIGSISHATDEDNAYIGTNVDYAIYVHNGTWKMKPRPFLERGIQDFIDEYREIAENYLTGD